MEPLSHRGLPRLSWIDTLYSSTCARGPGRPGGNGPRVLRGAPTAWRPEMRDLSGEPGAGWALRAGPARCPASGRQGSGMGTPRSAADGVPGVDFGRVEGRSGPTEPGELCHPFPTCCVTEHSPALGKRGEPLQGAASAPRLAALPDRAEAERPFWQSPWGWSLPPRVHPEPGVCFGVGVDRKGDCVQISVGVIWMKELKTPGSAVFPASLITTPILTPAPKNIFLKNLVFSTPSLSNTPRSCDCSCAAAGDV